MDKTLTTTYKGSHMAAISNAPRFALTALAAAIGVSAGTAHAANYTVTSLAASGSGTLSEAITVANANAGADTISFGVNGTIALGSDTLPGITDDLDIVGPGPGYVTIDGGGVASEGVIFRAGLAGADAVSISGLKLTNANRGAFYADSSVALTVDNVTVTGNDVSAIDLIDIIEGASLTLTDSKVTANDVTSEGNILYISGGTGHSITDTDFEENTSNSSSALLYLSAATVTVDNSNFEDNSGYNGAAIYAASSDLTITDSKFSGNRAIGGNGGAIYLQGTDLVLTNSNLTGNEAEIGNGGAIYTTATSTLTVTATQLSANRAALNGGAISSNNSALTISNSLLSDNHADPDSLGSQDGGAIDHALGTVSITDTTISDNTASGNGGGIVLDSADTTITRTQIRANSGDTSVVLNGAGGTVDVVQSRIAGNIGALVINDTAGATDFVVDQTTVANNSSTTGPAVAATLTQSGTELILQRSTFSGNSGAATAALQFDGSSDSGSPALLTVYNSTFSDNTATSASAGIIMGAFAATTVTNATFVNNAGDDAGSVQLYVPGSEGASGFDLSFSAFASSNADDLRIGGSSYNAVEYVLAVTGDNNIIQNGVDAISTSSITAPSEVDPGLAALADNGGFTETHAPISATSNTVGADTGTRPNGNTDQRGVANPDADADIGAVEYVANRAPQLAVDLDPKLSRAKGVALPTINLNTLITDPDGDTLTFTAINGLPPGVTADLGAGTISGTPTVPGTYNVTIEVEDDGSPVLSSVFYATATIAERRAGGSGGGGALSWLALSLLGLLGTRRRKTR